MKALTLIEEGTLMCLKAISRADDPVTTIEWSDDLDSRSIKKYEQQSYSMTKYEERRKETVIISCARGFAFGRMIEMFPRDYRKAVPRMVNF